jgi:hypothetical protein
MKIRNGFVSNSSSSSFCIMGIRITSELYYKIGKERKPTTLDTETGISHDDVYYIGYNPDKMGEDETLGQFKDRIVTEAARIGISIEKKDLTWITDGGYNG